MGVIEGVGVRYFSALSSMLQGVPEERISSKSKKDCMWFACMYVLHDHAPIGDCKTSIAAGPVGRDKAVECSVSPAGSHLPAKAEIRKLEVSEEVFEQWKKGGKPRNLLLQGLIAANGDKDNPASQTCHALRCMVISILMALSGGLQKKG